jgi:phage tail-like protein
MARATISDPLHNFRFHAKATETVNFTTGNRTGDVVDVLQPAGTGAGFSTGEDTNGQAGFQTITAPELTLDHVEYREGIKTYTEKYPGIPTVNDITFNRGVVIGDTSFYDWILNAIEGSNYRTTIDIYHAHKVAHKRPYPTSQGWVPDSLGVRTYRLINASPGRVKLSGDLDASSGDVSVAEMDVKYERVEMIPGRVV